MITYAKVNIQAVKQFEQAASVCRDFSPKFDRGTSCINVLLSALADCEKIIKSKVQNLQNAQDKLEVKIKNIEEKIARLTARLNELESKLEGLECELSNTDSGITITNKKGKETTIPNPAYLALKAKIAAVEGEIEGVRAELYRHQCRAEKANAVAADISQLIDELNSVLYSLSEKKSECKELQTEIENVKNHSLQRCQHAVDNLKKIQQIIASYMRIKMVYNAPTDDNKFSAQNSSAGININININTGRQKASENECATQTQSEGAFSAKEIQQHGIKFDAEKHICEYDGKSFGGTYNSYEERIKGTSADNPILGFYEGPRGESKYIPTNRSADGIVVIDILKKYGLDGIEYRNGEPDFEACAESVVEIKHMTEYRYDFEAPDGVQGNFSQADIVCAALWNFEEKDGRSDWTPRKVSNYRKANGLTWHEKCDTKTMVLVRSEINAYFKHIGGCSECRLRDSGALEEEFDE